MTIPERLRAMARGIAHGFNPSATLYEAADELERLHRWIEYAGWCACSLPTQPSHMRDDGVWYCPTCNGIRPVPKA